MKLTLVVLSEGKWQGKEIPVPQLPFLVGRDPQCHLRPASSLISNRHGAILSRDGQLLLRDLGSTNGSTVNGQLLRKAEAPIQDGDEITFGPLKFTVKVQGAVPGSPSGSRRGGQEEAVLTPSTLSPPQNAPADALTEDSPALGAGDTAQGPALSNDDTQPPAAPPPPQPEAPPKTQPTPRKKSGSTPAAGTQEAADVLLRAYLRRLREEGVD